MIVDDYILFDFPGQVELFTHHGSVKNILEQLQKVNYRVRLNFFFVSIFQETIDSRGLLSVFIAGNCSSGRCTLLHRSGKVYISAVAIFKNHAATGIATCECSL
jgi:hypothetical protein